MMCAACNIAEAVVQNLCQRCFDEIEQEILTFEQENAALVALAEAAADAGLDCRPASEPFDSVIMDALSSGTITNWRQWARTDGLEQLRIKLREWARIWAKTKTRYGLEEKILDFYRLDNYHGLEPLE